MSAVLLKRVDQKADDAKPSSTTDQRQTSFMSSKLAPALTSMGEEKKRLYTNNCFSRRA